MKQLLKFYLGALVFFIFTSTAAYAQDCTAPEGYVGDMTYNTSHKVLQYCNGTNWIAMNSFTASADSCYIPAFTCPVATSSQGCISSLTLSWSSVTCSTSGDRYQVVFTEPRVEGLAVTGTNTAGSKEAAQFFCEDLGFTYRYNTASTSAWANESYLGTTRNVTDEGWRYRTPASGTKVDSMTCFINVNAPR